MLDEDAILQIRGSCACDGGNYMMKIAAEKMENVGSIFSVTIFVTPSQSSQDPRWVTKITPKKSKTSVWFFWSQSSQDPRRVTKIVSKKIENVGLTFSAAIFVTPLAIITGPSMGDKNHTEKIENVSLIFSVAIFFDPHLLTYRNHHRSFEFALLNLHQTFSGIYSSQYQSCESRNYDERLDENRGWKKSETTAGHWKNVSSVDESSRLAKTTDIKPLNLVTPLIWLGDLQCGCTFTTSFSGSQEDDFSRSCVWRSPCEVQEVSDFRSQRSRSKKLKFFNFLRLRLDSWYVW